MELGVFVIAEIGCNHMGNPDIALSMIDVLSSLCKVDAVKFQKRTVRELLSEEEYNAPHPEPRNSYGTTYGEHRERLEFDVTRHRALMEYCRAKGLKYSCSVWDPTAAREIVSLSPDFIKIPSACNTDFRVHDYLCREFSGEIHVSLGMTSRAEEEIVSRFVRFGRNKDVVLYSCTSGYPVPFEDVCLMEIERLRERYASVVKAIGFSGHHLGIAADVAAMTLGATYIERHFTLDRTWKGTDHAASLEPDGMRRLVRDLHNVGKALRFKEEEILAIELAQSKKLKRPLREARI
ncbi:MAG: N-acetylneuraminate synthase family protein [Synergistaceae bacterium]|jgi:N-acetylneuraminate synthase|nr:N-acetylneuraminate synthase family protein [Synergistaceae bacterium]